MRRCLAASLLAVRPSSSWSSSWSGPVTRKCRGCRTWPGSPKGRRRGGAQGRRQAGRPVTGTARGLHEHAGPPLSRHATACNHAKGAWLRLRWTLDGACRTGGPCTFSCTFLGGRQVRWVESSRWGEFDTDRRGVEVEVPGIRRGRVVWCPGPCRRDLVHGHGCLMLGSERKGAVAPRVPTILPVPESLESRVESREESNGPSSQQAQQQEQSKLLSFIPRYLPTDPGTTHKEVSLSLLLDLGNRLGSNRGLKLEKESATKKKKTSQGKGNEGGVRSQSSPLRTGPLLLDRKYL